MLEIVKGTFKRENKIICISFANISNHCRLCRKVTEKFCKQKIEISKNTGSKKIQIT